MSDFEPLTFRLAGLGLRMYPGDYPAQNLDPHRHQWGMYDALTSGISGAFVNAAPTGSGKTESWVAPVVEKGLDTIAVYPTNALIEDQRRGIDRLLEDIDGGDDVALLNVTSETIGPNGKYAEQFPEAKSNGERLSQLLGQQLGRTSYNTTILLTNPDTFVLMRRGLYNSRVENVRRFEVAVVDEFHRANRKEQNTMLFLLDEMYDLDESVCGLNQLVFLSATPDAELEAKFENSLSAPYYRADEFAWADDPSVPDVLDGEPSQVDFEPDGLPEGYRDILPPVELTVFPSQTFQTATEMLDDDSFVSQVRDGECVIMLDGIHEVDRVYRALRNAGVTGVARIDGFHRKNLEEKLKAPTLVSNSAVEVGVNFDTEQIMFSGHDASSFFQRLGRLRNREDESVARGYVPKYTFSKLTDLDKASGDMWLPRGRFEDELKEIYVDAGRAPESFDRRYSAVEAYDHIRSREDNAMEDRKKELRRDGYQRLSRHFFPGETLTKDDVQRLHNAANRGVLDGLKTYRGESIQTLVFDQQEQSMQAYNIPYLLRHGSVSFVPREEFLNRVPESEHADVRRLKEYSAGYCIYRGSADNDGEAAEYAGRHVAYKATGQLYTLLSDHPRNSREPKRVTGLEVEVDGHVEGLSHLKDALSEREVLCYALEGNASKIQNLYSLGPFGFIYPLRYSGGDAAVAFGHDALHLHCRVQDQAEKDAADNLDEVLDW
ncbi:type I-D CRISPR-associated helicase Cas3' [Salinigranum rubrum]|uniref:Type I-D CRISPR-associated helicase Cas3 n=1 Tax=Salinigranum rubrum TaxID=755307 RepID=A0A2I8VLZ6_9EURY|nr:type I-D CRISPR-associated helicase Cas3' [Salinigranum rubrum]AUV82904.1 type I-D CRISPR-associated helicase Cas3' [Salinigranum rubrum]